MRRRLSMLIRATAAAASAVLLASCRRLRSQGVRGSPGEATSGRQLMVVAPDGTHGFRVPAAPLDAPAVASFAGPGKPCSAGDGRCRQARRCDHLHGARPRDRPAGVWRIGSSRIATASVAKLFIADDLLDA